MSKMGFFSLLVGVLFSSVGMTESVLYPDEFVIERLSFSPSQVRSGEVVTARAEVSLLKPRSENCQYVKCWGQMVLPTGTSINVGGDSCEIRQIDPLNIEVILKPRLAKNSLGGFYRFQGISLKASCHDYAFYYDGPRSRFKVVD